LDIFGEPDHAHAGLVNLYTIYIGSESKFLNWIKLEHGESFRLTAETPIAGFSSVFVEDEYDIDDDIPDTCRTLMLRKIHTCSCSAGRTRRSSIFTLFHRVRVSAWDDYLPALPFRMGRWSGPLLALSVGLGADIARRQFQGRGWPLVGWLFCTSVKTICEQSVFWSVAARMPNLGDYLFARFFARALLTLNRQMMGPSRWVKVIELWGVIGIGMLGNMRRHLLVFYTHRLLMGMIDPSSFTVAASKELWRSELAFVGQAIYEWGWDEIIHFPISFFATIFWPDFVQNVYNGIITPMNIPLNI